MRVAAPPARRVLNAGRERRGDTSPLLWNEGVRRQSPDGARGRFFVGTNERA